MSIYFWEKSEDSSLQSFNLPPKRITASMLVAFPVKNSCTHQTSPRLLPNLGFYTPETCQVCFPDHQNQHPMETCPKYRFLGSILTQRNQKLGESRGRGEGLGICVLSKFHGDFGIWWSLKTSQPKPLNQLKTTIKKRDVWKLKRTLRKMKLNGKFEKE